MVEIRGGIPKQSGKKFAAKRIFAKLQNPTCKGRNDDFRVQRGPGAHREFSHWGAQQFFDLNYLALQI